jgi:adenosylmethionine-8-amino-7-oxononanoate aminotransferase
MPGPIVKGTLTNGTTANSNATVAGDVMCVPTGKTSMRLTLTGLDGSNTVKTQKRTAGGAFADQVTYNSNQSAAAITVATGEEWRVVSITQQVVKDVQYTLDCES